MEKRKMSIQEEIGNFQKEILEFLSPKEIYLPITKEDTILMKQKMVKKNDCLWIHNEKKIYSPISGKITKIVKKKNILQQECTYLHIKNDFMENDHYDGGENTTRVITNDVLKKIYNKKELAKFKNKKSIILFGIEEEPLIKNRPTLHKLYKREILLQLDALKEAFQIENVKIFLKENDEESIEDFEQVINTYPYVTIKLIPDIYPLIHPILLNQYLKITKEDIVISTEDIIELYYEMIKLRNRDFLLITIAGDALKKSVIIKVKPGTNLKEIIPKLNIIDSYDIILNSLLKGHELIEEDFILTEEVRGLFFMKKQNEEEKTCNLCGKCNEVCPLKQNPYKSVMTKGKYKNKNCISCGLCSYICPSKINIRKYLNMEGK